MRKEKSTAIMKSCYYCNKKSTDKTLLALHYVRSHWEDVRKKQKNKGPKTKFLHPNSLLLNSNVEGNIPKASKTQSFPVQDFQDSKHSNANHNSAHKSEDTSRFINERVKKYFSMPISMASTNDVEVITLEEDEPEVIKVDEDSPMLPLTLPASLDKDNPNNYFVNFCNKQLKQPESLIKTANSTNEDCKPLCHQKNNSRAPLFGKVAKPTIQSMSIAGNQQKVQIMISSDGKVEVCGLLSWQQLFQMPDGKLQIFNSQGPAVSALKHRIQAKLVAIGGSMPLPLEPLPN